MNTEPSGLRALSNLGDIVPYVCKQREVGGDPAAVCGDAELSWTEFEAKTSRLASVLQTHGIEHEERVGIYLHKSIESLVAVYGVLRSGACYVPLDPLAPVTTTASIIQDCEVSVLVTANPASRRLTDVFECVGSFGRAVAELLVIGADSGVSDVRSIPWSEVDEYAPIEPQEIDPDGIAYIMYTSGSTGVPKGIVHTHRSGLAYALNAATLYELCSDDRMASLSPLHFDMSLLEFFAGVMVGATIVIVAEPYLKVPASLGQLLSEARCTTLYAVPSLYQQLLHRGGLADRDYSALRLVLTAGEVFPVEPLRSLFQLWSHATFSNVYGPAEVNQCSYFTFDSADAIPVASPLPIGQPWKNTEFKVLDDDDNPVRPGERGLLVVATSTMMRGYWKRPDLNSRAFVELENQSGHLARWYRTGDVVARRDDGELVFFGRRDNQVKVRGYRVELEMVEDAVCGMPGIAQAVVGPQLLESGDTCLAAFYELVDERDVETEPADTTPLHDDWLQRLALVLPSYAIPRVFSEVPAFPLTASGKIDRRTVRESIQQAVD